MARLFEHLSLGILGPHGSCQLLQCGLVIFLSEKTGTSDLPNFLIHGMISIISLFLFSLFFRVCLFLFVCIMGTIFIPLVFVSMLFLGCQLMFEKHWRSKNTFVYYTLRVYLPSAHELLVSY